MFQKYIMQICTYFFFKISKCIDIFLKHKLHLLDWNVMCKLMVTLIFSFSHSSFDLLFSLDTDILLFYLEAMNFSKTNCLYCCIFLVFNEKLLKNICKIAYNLKLICCHFPLLHCIGKILAKWVTNRSKIKVFSNEAGGGSWQPL